MKNGRMEHRWLLALPVALAGLLIALGAGAIRLMLMEGLGVVTWPVSPALRHHGELMVFSFLAPVIMLERYAASRAFRLPRPVRALPLAAGSGSLLFTVGSVTGSDGAASLGTVALAGAAVLYLSLLRVLARRAGQPAIMGMLALAGAALLAALGLTRFFSPIQNMGLTMLLLAFPVLTVMGERVELGSILNPSLERYAPGMVPLLAASLALFAGAGVLPGTAAGAAMLAAAGCLWLGVAALLAWSEGLPGRRAGDALHRYLSRCVMAGYGWLMVGGLLLIAYALLPEHRLFDGASHAVALGFVLGMILAHAPVILPALLNREAVWDHLTLWPLALHSTGTLARVGGRLLSPWLPEGWGQVLVGMSWLPVVLGLATLAILLVRGLKAGERKAPPVAVTVSS